SALKKSVNAYTQEVESCVKDALARISDSKDDVSKALQEVFATAVLASGDILEKARLRKERGNPPGKLSQALGDQITWEGFLSTLNKETSDVWIITSDNDYFVNRNNRCRR